jgi:hypothetical protein
MLSNFSKTFKKNLKLAGKNDLQNRLTIEIIICIFHNNADSKINKIKFVG